MQLKLVKCHLPFNGIFHLLNNECTDKNSGNGIFHTYPYRARFFFKNFQKICGKSFTHPSNLRPNKN